VLEGFVDAVEEGVAVERLRQIAVDPLASCIHRVRDIPVCSEDDDGQRRVPVMNAREQLHAVHAVHPQIADDHVRLAREQPPEGFLPALRGGNIESGTTKSHGQELQKADVVIDQKDALLSVHARPGLGLGQGR
jgi:hypothetical protein